MTSGEGGGASVVIVNYNSGDDLDGCLRSLARQERVDEVIVVDNCSTDGSELVTSAHGAKLVRSRVNDGYAGGANRGARVASSPYLVFLNPDVSLHEGCLARLVERLERGAGVAGPLVLVGPDRTPQYGYTVDALAMPKAYSTDRPPLYVTGCVLATSRQVFQSVGGFDSRYFMFCEDAEYCWRALLAGHRVEVVADAVAEHEGGAATAGGYVRAEVVETTSWRLAMRERNGLAMLLVCLPWRTAAWAIPAEVLKLTAMVVVAPAIGRPDLSRQLVAGMGWNLHQFRETLRRRRSCPRDPSGEREASRRRHRGMLALRALRRWGLPRFVDSPGPTSS